ncbi:flagellar motor switch protein FliN [Allopusillimonas ginsengisoli]|uniref:flagellar motor switch protein FliN n=1 Tax=Allopusillimonas ginsengisoli TaxID=453575 RepID=UPI001020CE79|nr:flagellar motor switch protein FliN [Allopusillimonas ginsengisoli]TEA79401.1 flagellar motor switch protein FliN [Allopusillimonas ginsengisoli]
MTSSSKKTRPDSSAFAPAAQDVKADNHDAEWAAAFAEQGNPTTSPKGAAVTGNDNTSAQDAQTAAHQTEAQSAEDNIFKPLIHSDALGSTDIDMIGDIPVQLSVELGRTRLTIKNILQLGQGSVVELDGLAGEPMDIFVNGYLIAQGEVVVVDEKYGIRITDIITPADRINRLNGRR